MADKMNKRCMSKLGTISIIVVVTLTLLASLFFLGILVSADTTTRYPLGERIRIDLGEDIGTYSLYLKTPSTSYYQKPSSSVFIFEPQEEGSYTITITTEEQTDTISFEVYQDENFVQPTHSSSTPSTTPQEPVSQESRTEEIPKRITVGEEVIWQQELSGGKTKIKIPLLAENITLDDPAPTYLEVKESLLDSVNNLFTETPEKSVIIESTEKTLLLTYTTPAPVKEETIISDTHKEITVSAPLHYEDVLVYTNLTKPIPFNKKHLITLYWKENNTYLPLQVYDHDNDGKIEQISFIAPHLSTQTFQVIIEIIEAYHLDEEQNIISEVYDKLQAIDDDGVFVNKGEYIRVTFEQELMFLNDITIYANSTPGTIIEVYEVNGTEKLAEFTDLETLELYRVMLTSLAGMQNIFDLKVVNGSVWIDYIVDPSTIYQISTDAEPVATGTVSGFSGGRNIIRLNNNNLIAYWEDDSNDPTCALSSDNGVTWPTTSSLAVGGSSAYDMAITTNGTSIVYLALDYNGGDDVGYVIRNTNTCDVASGTFADVSGMTSNYLPDIAFDSSHARYVVCSTEIGGGGGDDLDYAYSAVGTTLSWTGVDAVGGARTFDGCSIEVNSAGNVFIAMDDSANTDIRVFNSSAGTFASNTETTIYTTGVNDLHLSIRGDEILITAVDTNSDLVVINSSTNASSYTSTVLAGTFSQAEGCIDAYGRYHLAVSDGSDIDYIQFSNGQFGDFFTIDDTAATLSYPSVRCTNYPTNNRMDPNELELVYTDVTNTAIYFANFTVPVNDSINGSPRVTILAPNTTYTTGYINFSISLNEPGNTCNYTLTNGMVNYTMTANSTNYGFTASNASVPDGTYTMKAYCSDYAGNTNITVTSNFTVQTSSLNLTLNAPLTGGTTTDITPLLNITLSGATAAWAGYSVNGGTNQTICTSCIGTKTLYVWLNESPQTITVYANDSLGQLVTASTNITVNMYFSYNDTYDDNSSIFSYDKTTWAPGNITFIGSVGSDILSWNAFQQTGDSSWANSGRSGHSFRLIIRNSSINTSGNNVRFQFQAGTDAGQTFTVNRPSLCERFAQTSNCTYGTWVNLTIGGDRTYAISSSQENWTDWIEYDFNESKDYLLSYYLGTTSNAVAVLGAGGGNNVNYHVDNYDLSTRENWSTHIPAPIIETNFYSLEDIEVRSSNLSGSITSYTANISSSLVEFSNITWTEQGTGNGGNITLQVSADNGANWYNTTKNQGLTGIATGNRVIYRALFTTNNSVDLLTLLGVNVSWTDSSAPAPDPIIITPVTGSTISDVTPTLNISLSSSAATLKYSINGISNTTLCTSCSGNQIAYLPLYEGTFTVRVYTTNYLGEVKYNATTFTVETNYQYYDNYDDNSSFINAAYNDLFWETGSINFSGKVRESLFYDDFEDGIDGWNFFGGTWVAGSGTLQDTANTDNTFAMSPAENMTAGTNYNISMVAFDADNDKSGIAFRYINTTDYYRCIFVIDTGQGGPGGTIDRITGGTTTTLSSTSSTYTQNAWNNYSLSIINNNIYCYLNGQLLMSATDSTWENGRVGIYNGFQTNVQYDNYTIEQIFDVYQGNITAYKINVTETISQITNVTWDEAGTSPQNNLTVQLSTNGGTNWYTATNKQALTTTPGSSLLYRLLFSTTNLSNLSVSAFNITWTDYTSPAPAITMYSPATNTTIADVTPTLNLSINESASRVWYSTNNGVTNTTLCTLCSAGTYNTYLYLREGNFNVFVYANNSVGQQSINYSNFTINLNQNYYDNYDDNSSLLLNQLHRLNWSIGNITLYSQQVTPFTEGFEGASINNTQWPTSGGWTINSTRANTGSNAVYAASTANDNLTSKEIDVSLFDEINVTFWYNEDDLDVGDIALFFYNGTTYNLIDEFGADQVSEDTWYFKSYVTSDPQYLRTDFAIRLYAILGGGANSERIWIDDVIINLSRTKGNFTAYTINVTQPIKAITNITWTESGTSTNKNITTQLSFDGGNLWYNATKNQGLSGFNSSSAMLYRVLFLLNDTSSNISLLDMNITWSAPPTVTITYPQAAIYNSTITQLNYTVISTGTPISHCWWTNNSGVTNYSVTCGQNITTTSVSGINIWTVYANDTGGSVGSSTVNFTVDTSSPMIIFINQTNPLEQNVTVTNPLEQGQNLTLRANVIDSNLDRVWIIVWDTIKGGTEKFRTFLTYMAGIGLWVADITTNLSWNLTNYNYTIYANDTAGYTSELDGNFSMTRINSSLNLNPNPTSGGNVTATGSVTFINGTFIPNYPINLWLNGQLLYFANVTIIGTYNSYQNKTDTSDQDFGNGTFYKTTTSGGNLTLATGNNTGNFTKILDAGAKVEWNAITWNTTGDFCLITQSWQDGTLTYDSTTDFYLDGSNANTNYGSVGDLLLDTSPLQRAAIKFDVFGYGPYKIPYNSTIIEANITISVNDSGDSANIYEILENWSESDATYNNRLPLTAWGSSGIAGSPSRSTILESTVSPSTNGNFTFNITNVMKRWANQSANNYGVVLSPGGTNTVSFKSRENPSVAERPKLTVRFNTSDCTSVVAYARFSDDNQTWTSWQTVTRGAALTNPLIASRYLQYVVELATFNASIRPNITQIITNFTALVTDASGNYAYNFTSPTGFGSYPVIFNTSLRTMFTNASATLLVQTGVTPQVTLISPPTGTWYNYTNFNLTYNSTDLNNDLANASLYLNGIYNQSNATPLNNGLNNFTFTYGEGTYNWSINVSDASGNYNFTTNRTINIDLTNPLVNLLYPQNNTSFTANSVNLSINASDNMDTNLSCSIMLDGTIIHNNVGVANATAINRSSGTLAAGTHYWNATCYDESLRSYTTPTWQFIISDTSPIVTLDYPVPNYSDSDGNISFGFNVTDNSGILNCSLIINETFRISNQSIVNYADAPGLPNIINATNLPEGRYNWTVECFDLSSTRHAPTARNFTVDLNNPFISLVLPLNATILSTSSINFNFTANDTIGSSLLCNLTVDGIILANITATNATLTNQLLEGFTDGNKYWNVTCMDDSGRTNTSETRLLTIAEPPRIYLNTTNSTSFPTSTATLEYTPHDNTDFATCSIYLNGAYNSSNASTIFNNQLNQIVIENMQDGTYYWYINCTDYYGYINVSETRVFYIDAQPPIINLSYPQGHDIFAANVTFNFTVIDYIDSSLVCNLTVDSTIVDSNISVANNTLITRNVSGITDGYHTWYVNCSDSSGNFNTSQTNNFTKYTAPNVLLISPNHGYWYNYSTINLTYYLEDDEGFRRSYLYLNATLNQTNTSTLTNVDNNNFTLNGIADGYYNWTVIATDLGGMNGTDTTRTFYVDTKAPTITLNSPFVQELLSTNNVTINLTVIDNLDSQLYCNLSIDYSIEYSGNISNATPYITYQLLADGIHIWNISCIDEAGNFNTSEVRNFTVEAPPYVNLTTPAMNYKATNSTFNFSYIPYDPIGINQCIIYLDGIVNNTNNGPTPNVVNNFTITGITEGIHNWTVNCSDADTNWNWSTERNFTRDASAPNITLNAPLNNSFLNANSNILFNWTATDTYDTLMTCDLYVDGILESDNVLGTSGFPSTDTQSGISSGLHTWNVTCWDTLINTNYSQTWTFNYTYPDFSVNNSEIYFNTTSPEENSSVNITATITNQGLVNASNVNVRFYRGDPDAGGTLIGINQTVTLYAQTTLNVSIIANFSIGTSTVYVVVDAPYATNGSIIELNETNNKAFSTITVGSWNFFYGGLAQNSEFILADSTAYKVTVWNMSGATNASILAADYDSNIEWTQLQAITKRIDGSNATNNDFADIDNALSMSTYYDSVNATYTINGTITEQRNYNLFDDPILLVPVTNSINSTNFKTGILWDTSDDAGNNEYDNTTKEDLLFITQLNPNTAGTYGVVDYELRVPALLRSYKGPNSQLAALYVELT